MRTLAAVPWLSLNPVRLMNDNKAIAGVNLGRLWGEQERIRGWIGELLRWLGEGRIRPHVDRTFPLRQAAAAHRYLHERRNVGKVLLVPEPGPGRSAA